MLRALPAALALFASGCLEPNLECDDASATAALARTEGFELVDAPGFDRPARLFGSGSAAPLVVALHGYSSCGRGLATYWDLPRWAEERGVAILLPDGTIDRDGNRFWNATPSCCDFDGAEPDDLGYLQALAGEVQAGSLAAPGRVAVIGHSNGAYMSHRWACDGANGVRAIGALAGPGFSQDVDCQPSEPVRVLQIHGTWDLVVRYDDDGDHPGARTAAARWADRNGCAPTSTPGEPLDLVGGADAETTVDIWTDCLAGGAAELWSIARTGHIPAFHDRIGDDLIAWVLR